MRTLIDGYNLMHARGLMDRKFPPDGLRKVRHKFLIDLAAALDPTEAHNTTVVFDAKLAPPDRPDHQKLKGITVLFAVNDEDADARIEILIAAHSAPKLLTVVSTDLRIRRAAERRRAIVMTSDDFLAKLEKKNRRPKVAIAIPKTPEETGRQQGPTAAEADYWMAEFAEVAQEPGIRDSLRASDFVPTDEEIAQIEREVREEG